MGKLPSTPSGMFSSHTESYKIKMADFTKDQTIGDQLHGILSSVIMKPLSPDILNALQRQIENLFFHHDLNAIIFELVQQEGGTILIRGKRPIDNFALAGILATKSDE